MAIVARLVVAFISLWCLLYLAVYIRFLYASRRAISSESSVGMSTFERFEAATPLAVNEAKDVPALNLSKMKTSQESFQRLIFNNPMLSPSCEQFISQEKRLIGASESIAVIIVIVSESKEAVLRTISSLLLNTDSLMVDVYLVDNSFDLEVNSWTEWSLPPFDQASSSSFALHHLRPSRPLKNEVSAKLYALSTVASSHHSTLLFLDADVIVSRNFLIPLIASIRTHPNTIVYPAVDIISEDKDKAHGVEVIKGDRMVSAFNWALTKTWVPISPSQVSSSEDDDDDIDEVFSPGFHSTFGISASFFQDIGGLDATLLPPLAEIELSLRVWLCGGGSIIRQPCSRLAQTFSTFASHASHLHSQTDFNAGVVAISHRWMEKRHRDAVFQARFLGRIPEKITIALNNLHPEEFSESKLMNEYRCLPLDWYIKEIHTSLSDEIMEIQSNFSAYLSSDYLSTFFRPLLQEYEKASDIELDASTEKALNAYREKYHDADSEDIQLQRLAKTYVDEQHFAHAAHVKKTLLCEDESFVGAPGCAAFKARGGCTREKDLQYAMFGCPKTCGLCDFEGKQLCADFFRVKCPQMKKEGKCTSDIAYMEENCRLACGFCSRSSPAASLKVTSTEQSSVKATPAPQSLALTDGASEKIDPFAIHRRFLAGEIPDPSPSSSSCSLNRKPNGDLLSRIKVESNEASAGPKLFCGIYTMESNHATNVKAAIETWAKHCDGFVAFSTKSDPTLSAIFIEHEGVENYNNMWQKSRSIWKYIYSHFLFDFDFFLMGGDDMFYIIGNLRHYLMSPEVVSEGKRGQGLYLGRKFQPPGQPIFNSGGAGYVLDRTALKFLGENLDKPECFAHQVGFWEDVNIANCLRKSNKIEPFDTRDAKKRERFHPFTPGQHLTYRIPPNTPDWYAKYNPNLTLGYECCSDESISFHYVPHDLMRTMYEYVHLCNNKMIRHNEYP